MIDLHTHSTRCNHALGTPEEYVQAAIAQGIREFGFSDHSHWMLHGRQKAYAMRANELADYVSDVQALKARYNVQGSPIRLRLGMEMDYIPSRLAEATRVIAAYPWDYLIGSVHNVGFELLQSAQTYEEWSIDDVCELYFYQLHNMINARFGDIIGHLDLPKKMGGRPAKGMLYYIEPLLADLRHSGMVVEINTSGLDNPAGEFMPGWDTVARLIQEGIPLTVSSDAHAPAQVGRYFKRAHETLRQLGVHELWRFEARRAIAEPLTNF